MVAIEVFVQDIEQAITDQLSTNHMNVLIYLSSLRFDSGLTHRLIRITKGAVALQIGAHTASARKWGLSHG
jgi:hypothetical protein